jgi:hypothetical protein
LKPFKFVSICVAGSTGTDPGSSDGGTNVDPVANAGGDQMVSPRHNITLDERSSSDSDGWIVQYRWTQVSGSVTASLKR